MSTRTADDQEKQNQTTPGRPRESSSRQQKSQDQQTQTGSGKFDKESSGGGMAPQENPTRAA